MEPKTRLETLISQHDSQQEIVISREAQVRVLRRLDPHKVVELRMDSEELRLKQVTAKMMLEKAEEKLELDRIWLEEIRLMIEEEKASLK